MTVKIELIKLFQSYILKNKQNSLSLLGRNNCQRFRMTAWLPVPFRKMKKHKTFSIHLVRILKIWITLLNSIIFFYFHLFINRIRERVGCIWVTKDDCEIKQYQIKGQDTPYTNIEQHCIVSVITFFCKIFQPLFHIYCWNFELKRRMIVASIHFDTFLKNGINISSKNVIKVSPSIMCGI